MTAIYEDLPVVATAAQVATILGCSERHVRSLIATGRLGSISLGRLVKIPRHSLLELLGAESEPTAPGEAVNTNTDSDPGHRLSRAKGDDPASRVVTTTAPTTTTKGGSDGGS